MPYIQTANNAGLVKTVRNRLTHRLVSIYRSAAAGIEDDPALPYTTVCEDHGRIICHQSLRYARRHLSDPAGWCGVCAGTEEE